MRPLTLQLRSGSGYCPRFSRLWASRGASPPTRSGREGNRTLLIPDRQSGVHTSRLHVCAGRCTTKAIAFTLVGAFELFHHCLRGPAWTRTRMVLRTTGLQPASVTLPSTSPNTKKAARFPRRLLEFLLFPRVSAAWCSFMLEGIWVVRLQGTQYPRTIGAHAKRTRPAPACNGRS